MSKVKIIAVVIAGIIALAVVIPSIIGVSVPKQQKLIDCTNSVLAFPMVCLSSPPYQFVLGVPTSETNVHRLKGELNIRQNSTLIAHLPIDSTALIYCNWLNDAGLSGYILTESRTNGANQLSKLLQRGQSYSIQVSFTSPPPQHSSLWFSSMRKVRW